MKRRRGGSRPCQGPTPRTAETPPSTTTVETIVERLLGRAVDPTVGFLMRGMAAGLTPVPSGPVPFIERAVDDVDRRRAAGSLRRCRHLRQGSAVLPVLLPWIPGELHCPPCAQVLQAGLSGTVEDFRCDSCRQVAERLRTSAVTARGMVILIGVCELCRLSGQAGPA